MHDRQTGRDQSTVQPLATGIMMSNREHKGLKLKLESLPRH